MKPYSIRLPNEVYEKLKEMGSEPVRIKLIEIAGFTYSNDEKLLSIEQLVKKFLRENFISFESKKNEENHENLTNMAVESILSIIE